MLCAAALPLCAQEPTPQPPTPQSPLTSVRSFLYVCDDGVKLTVTYRSSSARVSYNGHIYLMKQVLSADGGRYSDGQLVWWSKGDGGFLAKVDDNSPTGGKQLATNCRGTAAPPAKGEAAAASVTPDATPGVITGTVSYMLRIALPPNAVAVVQLRDISLADATAPVIAEEKINFGDRQVPIPFDLKFDPAKIDQRHNYSVSATIMVDGAVRFRTDSSSPVITHGHPSKVDLVLEQVEDHPPA